jgi:predicted CXXCH cytochrome family protein
MWFILLSALITILGSSGSPQKVGATDAILNHNGTSSPIGAGADSCRTCHSGGSFDLSTETDLNCFGCHRDTQEKALKAYKHSEVINDKYPTISCEGCHKLHKANGNALLSQDESTLCRSCHPENGASNTHPVVDMESSKGQLITGSDGRPLTCASHCHDVHGTDYQFMCRLEPGRELCISCHKDFEK